MTASNTVAEFDRIARLTEALISAHSTGENVDVISVDGLITSQAEAYQVQAAVAQQLGLVVGWKVGRKGPDAVPVRAPLFENRLHRSGDVLETDIFRLWQLEAELMFCLGKGLPPIEHPYGRDEVLSAIDKVIVGFEIIDTRFATGSNVSPLLRLCDLLSHGAVVIGSGISLPPSASFERTPVSFAINGQTLIHRNGGNPAGDIVDLVIWLANDLATTDAGLREGDLVTTGSYTGLQYLAPGSQAEARFEDIGTVEITRAG